MHIKETLEKCGWIEKKLTKQTLSHFSNPATVSILVDSFQVFTLCITEDFNCIMLFAYSYFMRLSYKIAL